jgi:ABC-type branched-subunit amino acid transport system ATPase component
MTALLEVRNVTKTYGGVVANRDVSLSVPRRAIVGLIGPNGSGKTTLFSSIAGFHPIDSGSIVFDGQEISRKRPAEVARLGLIRTFQQTRVYGRMSCVQNMLVSEPHVREPLRTMFGRPRPEVREKAEALLQFVGLYGKRFLRAGDLSFGQQKLLELAMALMSDPKMLLLDEPTAGINPTLVNGLIDRLKRANRDLGVTLLVIEHNIRAIAELAGHLYCLAHGELLAEGPAARLQRDARVVDAYLGAH